jgi:hypothetical protein
MAIYNRVDHKKFPKWETESRRFLKTKPQTEQEIKAALNAWLGA